MNGSAQARQFQCGNCGAQLGWDARTRALRCDHCGASRPVAQVPGARIVEHDLFSNLGAEPRGLGASADIRVHRCRECGANVSFGGGAIATRCTFCGSPAVLEQPENASTLRPESLLPFAVDKKTANAHFARWLAGLWFRPNDLKRIARVQEVNGVYVPFWTYDALVDSEWRAERGWHYYTPEEYTIQENGQTVVRTRQVQHTRWEPAWGRRRDIYDDLLVCASRGLPAELAEHLRTFDTRQLIPYAPDYLAGWRAEEYAVDLQQGWQTAQRRIEAEQQTRCSRDVGGDAQRFLEVRSQYGRVTFKHVLLPIWIAAYRYHDKVYRFLVNGQTGEVVGKAPWSVLKILLFITTIVAAIVAIVLLVSD